jgi:phosphoglycolate phosphatase
VTNDAIIFDIDGTLWNATPATSKGWNLALAKLGIEGNITAEEVSAVAGNPYEKCVDILLPGVRMKYPELFDILNACEEEILQSEGGVFYDGVIEGIPRLARDHKIFLVSNCQEWYLDLFLDLSGIRPVFSGVDCYGKSGQPKNGMLLNMKHSHSLVKPVYVGDTAGDEAAAKLAGLEFIHVSWGFGKPEGKPKTIDSFVDFMDYLKKN